MSLNLNWIDDVNSLHVPDIVLFLESIRTTFFGIFQRGEGHVPQNRAKSFFSTKIGLVSGLTGGTAEAQTCEAFLW